MAPSLRIRDSTGQLVGDLTEEAVLQLPGAGSYRGELLFTVNATAEVLFDLDIAAQRTLRAPRWQPRASRTVESGSALRVVLAAWPEFSMPSNPDGAAAANRIIADFIAELEQEHAQAVTTCADDEDSMHLITYRPTLISYDLVAIDLQAFVGVCEGGNEVRRHSVIVDLNTNQQLESDDIVGLDTAELPALWWEVFVAQSYWSPEELDAEATELDFTTVSLQPHGVSLTADVSGLPDGPIELTATLSFDDLGDMVRPGIATRAASGAGARYPVEERCGC